MTHQETFNKQYKNKYEEWLRSDQEQQERPERLLNESRWQSIFETTFKELSKQRGDKERQTRIENRIGDEYLSSSIQVVAEKREKNAATVPQLMCSRVSKDRFYGNNKIQKDVACKEKQRIKDFERTWTLQELDLFTKRLKLVGKNFANIAMFFPEKLIYIQSVSDCVQCYYLLIKRYNSEYKLLLPKWKKPNKKKYRPPAMPTDSEVADFKQKVNENNSVGTNGSNITSLLNIVERLGKLEEEKIFITLNQENYQAQINSLNAEIELSNSTLTKLQEFLDRRQILCQLPYTQIASDSYRKAQERFFDNSDAFSESLSYMEKQLRAAYNGCQGDHVVIKTELGLIRATNTGLQEYFQQRKLVNPLLDLPQNSSKTQMFQIPILINMRTVLMEKKDNLKKKLKTLSIRQKLARDRLASLINYAYI